MTEDKKPKREPGRPADYCDATPEEVAKALLTRRLPKRVVNPGI